MAVAAGAQTYPFTGPGRAFSPWTESNNFSWTFAPAYPAGAEGQNTSLVTNTFINVDPYVFVGGLFDAAITVQGMGAGTSSSTNNDIQVLTNMDLTFNLVNFNAIDFIPDSGTATPGTNSVTVNYTFQTYSNYSTGQTINNTGNATGSVLATGNLTVTNSTATPQSTSVGLPLASTTDGVGALRITRSVSLTGQAPGDASYTSIGDVVVTIN
jgi:hypothetical protein